MKATGRKEVGEAVLTAFLTTLVSALVVEGYNRAAEALERRRPKPTRKGKRK